MTQAARRTAPPKDGDAKPCPRCRGTLVFSSGYPVLRARLEEGGRPERNRIRYHHAWDCRNGGCDYREFVGDADG